MKFLAESRNTGDPTPYLAQESARMQELVRSGVVERVWLKADWSGAVLIASADGPAAAKAALDTLPMVTGGITDFTLTEILDPPGAP